MLTSSKNLHFCGSLNTGNSVVSTHEYQFNVQIRQRYRFHLVYLTSNINTYLIPICLIEVMKLQIKTHGNYDNKCHSSVISMALYRQFISCKLLVSYMYNRVNIYLEVITKYRTNTSSVVTRCWSFCWTKMYLFFINKFPSSFGNY